MTPKEKAEKLVEKMYHSQIYDEDEKTFVIMTWERAKQCALVAVDFTINSFYEFDGFSPKTVDRDYFENIAYEIEKL